jgi:hypothetical protein
MPPPMSAIFLLAMTSPSGGDIALQHGRSSAAKGTHQTKKRLLETQTSQIVCGG